MITITYKIKIKDVEFELTAQELLELRDAVCGIVGAPVTLPVMPMPSPIFPVMPGTGDPPYWNNPVITCQENCTQ